MRYSRCWLTLHTVVCEGEEKGFPFRRSHCVRELAVLVQHSDWENHKSVYKPLERREMCELLMSVQEDRGLERENKHIPYVRPTPGRRTKSSQQGVLGEKWSIGEVLCSIQIVRKTLNFTRAHPQCSPPTKTPVDPKTLTPNALHKPK